MTDRELLEKAAKAASIELQWPQDLGGADYLSPRETADWQLWNPLTSDADALRLAVKLRLDLCHVTQSRNGPARVYATHPLGSACGSAEEAHGSDPCAATRRAIVRAAAALAESQVPP